MRWKTVAYAGCVSAPLFAAGCNIFYLSARNVVNEPIELGDKLGRIHDLRLEAKVAWKEVRGEYPRHLFTCEFRDGFLDGYADYLDRGGNAQPPAAPPKKYTRNTYMTPEGHALVNDYFLGFQYGVDVAVASGRRQFLVAPILLPVRPSGPPTFNIQRPGDDPAGCPVDPLTGLPVVPPDGALPAPPAATPVPVPNAAPVPVPPAVTAPRAVPPAASPPGSSSVPTGPGVLPPPTAVGVPPFTPGVKSPPPVNPAPAPTPPAVTPKGTGRAPWLPDLSGPKFGPADDAEVPVSAGPEDEPGARLPAPNPPIPAATVTIPVAPPVALPADPKVNPAGASERRLPRPPAAVRELPAGVPTPSVLDDVPAYPANHLLPAQLPVTHELPPRK